MKQFCLLALLVGSLFFSTGYGCFRGNPRSNDSLLTRLKSNRENTDQYYLTHADDMISFDKAPGVDTLLEVLDTSQQKGDHKRPDKPEYSYDILKDANGRIVYIDRMSSNENPYALHIYIHYFNDQGNTYAFMKKEAVFFNYVKTKFPIDFHLWYYDKNFKVIGETDTVKDSNHQVVTLTTDERKQMDFKHDIYKNVATCLKGYGIKLKY
jgi:hypothetical protein